MDLVGRFIAERCIVGPDLVSTAAELHAAYRAWSSERGDEVMSPQAFGNKLRHKFRKTRTMRSRMWRGIALGVLAKPAKSSFAHIEPSFAGEVPWTIRTEHGAWRARRLTLPAYIAPTPVYLLEERPKERTNRTFSDAGKRGPDPWELLEQLLLTIREQTAKIHE